MNKKQIAIILFAGISVMVGAACSNAPQTTQNAGNTAQNSTNSSVVSSHSTEQSKIPTAGNSSNSANPPSSSSSSPMAKAIDVSEMTAKIEKAEKEYKAKPKDEKANLALATAYFERATALTGAAQYRAALGDYRKGLKLNPDDKEAKAMHDQIISIFQSIGREPPKEGEEPTPMPINK